MALCVSAEVLCGAAIRGGDYFLFEDVPTPDLEQEDAKIPTEMVLETSLTVEAVLAKLGEWLRLLCKPISLFLVYATNELNAISKDYRFVAEALTQDKFLLKKWVNLLIPGNEESKSEEEVPALKAFFPQVHKGEHGDSPPDAQKKFKERLPLFVKFLLALWYLVISQSEILCYLAIIIYQIHSASLLSLPLPLLVFFWGSLAVPRPTKTFWFVVITYSEVIVLVKYFFHFNFWIWNINTCRAPQDQYQCAERMVGISRHFYNSLPDLLLLLAVFFHRLMMKSFGLWQNVPDSAMEISKKCKLVLSDSKKEEEESGTEEEGDKGKRSLDVFCSYFQPLRKFYSNIFSQQRLTDDVYAYTFFCEFINFFILIFGYKSFGMADSESVASYIQENRVPIPFLIMLLAQFGVIIIDRALYLRKNIALKLGLHLIMIVIIHIWMFFLLPYFSFSSLQDSVAANLWYLTKCISFLLSAYQIRRGYPRHVLGCFFCKNYTMVNLVCFKIYRIIPFMYELRCLMDWIWTDTSLAITSWFKMEDIYGHIFTLKCFREWEKFMPEPRGVARTMLAKYRVGGSMLVILILVIWFPLLFFAFETTFGTVNIPIYAELSLGFAGFKAIFQTTVDRDRFIIRSQSYWTYHQQYLQVDEALAHIFRAFSHYDVMIVPFPANSSSTWNISPPHKKKLIEILEKNQEIRISYTISFTRSMDEILMSHRTLYYKNSLVIRNKTLIQQILSTIKTNDTISQVVSLPTSFIPYIFVLNKRNEIKNPTDRSNSKFPNMDVVWAEKREISIRLHSTNMSQWWEVKDETCYQFAIYNLLTENKDCEDYIYILAFNSKQYSRELFIFSKYGIIGLYSTFVLVLHGILRSLTTDTRHTIMFYELPNVDRVLELCLDIYLVRENQEHALEEDLYAKLIFLYRSPETMIRSSYLEFQSDLCCVLVLHGILQYRRYGMRC
ncbi:hypothetical protein LAZ67_5000412 [Cordylochernes scorpioides]|uniref:Piezo non-specific cation channel R-Ras-binding domain-containing protein n=1 Tax=Cordylochernes scorpioides TaxID=51811 RepID=A0ABY6KHZ1_9ARAC|nr:hypothetical protein LAZ67_5000412 [Cordylochernes scorpioides]